MTYKDSDIPDSVPEMETESGIKLRVGQDYLTRGRWQARIIWIALGKGLFWAVHIDPKAKFKIWSDPVKHKTESGYATPDYSLIINPPPILGEGQFIPHPADIVGYWLPQSEG